MELSADQVVLISTWTPEHLAAWLVLSVALLAALFSCAMASRGRVEGWSLVGTFGLVALVAVFALAHMPTYVAFDRSGAEIAFGPLKDRRVWSDFAAVDAERLWNGVRLRFTPRAEAGRSWRWSAWPGLFIPAVAPEPRDLVMRVEAWRLAAAKK